MSTIAVTAIPSIEIFVRHSADCSRHDNPTHKGCKCPKHLRWSHDGKQYRQAAKTRSWAIAEERRREMEARFKAADPSRPIEAVTIDTTTRPTIQKAVELFLSDKRSQGLNDNFVKKYERELGRLFGFMKNQSRFFPHEMTVEDFTVFRAGW